MNKYLLSLLALACSLPSQAQMTFEQLTPKTPIAPTDRIILNVPLGNGKFGNRIAPLSELRSGLSLESSLGNPSVSGYVLSSTTGGVRSWIPMSGGGGGGDMTLAGVQTISGAKTFGSGTLKLAGSTSGVVTLNAPATGGGVLTLPAGTGTIALTSDLAGYVTPTTLNNGTLPGSFTTLSASGLTFPVAEAASPDFHLSLATYAQTNSPTNPVFAGRSDQVIEFGFNASAAGGKEIPSEHSFTWRFESLYNTAGGLTQMEWYHQYSGRDGTDIRPHQMDINLETNAVTQTLLGNSIRLGKQDGTIAVSLDTVAATPTLTYPGGLVVASTVRYTQPQVLNQAVALSARNVSDNADVPLIKLDYATTGPGDTVMIAPTGKRTEIGGDAYVNGVIVAYGRSIAIPKADFSALFNFLVMDGNDLYLGPNYNIGGDVILRNYGSGKSITIAPAGGEVIQAKSGKLYINDGGTLKEVSFGAADSGGTGFKTLRVTN